MSLKRIIKLKEGIKDERAREIRQIEMQIQALKKEVERIEAQAEDLNEKIKAEFSYELLIRYRALLSTKKEILLELARLDELKRSKKQDLREVYRDIKALETIKLKADWEERRKSLSLELRDTEFMHLIKERMGLK
ncbi:MAG: hypothetical protein D6674_03840 [Acidobacteria bacterium]|jgi:seryl-tRNA synthetase|nr:MAG: hypothetical protein D6674_03840 [Acidobacteriota bacterium]